MEYRAPPGNVNAAVASLPLYRNTFHALASIAQQEGTRGLFKGLWPTVLTNAPFSGTGATVGRGRTQSNVIARARQVYAATAAVPPMSGCMQGYTTCFTRSSRNSSATPQGHKRW